MAGEIRLHEAGAGNNTVVPNRFIDEFMTKANGEYVKIYLYLLRCLGAKEGGISIAKIAEVFNDTEGDVRRALNYWEKVQLLQFEFDENNELTEIYFGQGKTEQELKEEEEAKARAREEAIRKAEAERAAKAKADARQEAAAKALEKAGTADNISPMPAMPVYSMNQLASFSKREDIRQLLYICERYLGRTLSQDDVSYIIYWNRELGMSTDLIEFLIEHSVSVKGREKITTLRYLQNTAETWYRQGVETVVQAKDYLKTGAQQAAMVIIVMKALGIKGRNLIANEEAMIEKWVNAYGFGQEVISEACRRTITNIHEPSLNYVNKILESWAGQGVNSMEDIKKLDDAYHDGKKGKKAAGEDSSRGTDGGYSKMPKKNAPANGRQYDYADVTRQMLLQSL